MYYFKIFWTVVFVLFVFNGCEEGTSSNGIEANINIVTGDAKTQEYPAYIPDLNVSTLINTSLEFPFGLGLSILNQPTNGTIDINQSTGVVTYTPNVDFLGTDSFVYERQSFTSAFAQVVGDGADYSPPSETGTVYIKVSETKLFAPIATPDRVSIRQDENITIPILLNDIDLDGLLNPNSIFIIDSLTQGTVILGSNGTVFYSAPIGFVGTDSFSYIVYDNDGLVSNPPANVTIDIVRANEVPIANDDNVSVGEDQSVNIPILLNDVDKDGTIDTTRTVLVTPPTHGTVVFDVSGGAKYTPNPDFFGVDTFRYSIYDNEGSSSQPANVNIQVLPINDPPVAVDDNISTQEDVSVSVNVLNNDVDIDSDTLSIVSASLVDIPLRGSVTFSGGDINFIPVLNFSGQVKISYVVSDGTVSDTGLLTVQVNSVNDRPIAHNDVISTNEDTSVNINVLSNDTDFDGSIDPTTVVVTSNPNSGTAKVNHITGEVTYTPNSSFYGDDSFTYTVNDNSGLVSNVATVNISVNSVNDLPVIHSTPITNVLEGSLYTYIINASDVDKPERLYVSLVVAPTWLTLSTSAFEGGGSINIALSGTPTNLDVGEHNVSIRVSDGQDSVYQNFILTVINTNDAPVFTSIPITKANVDVPYSYIVVVRDFDIDDTLVLSDIKALPEWMTLDPRGSVFAQGDENLLVFTLVGTPTLDDVGEHHVSITVGDGIVDVDHNFTITVLQPEHTLVGVDDFTTIEQDSGLNFLNVISNDIDSHDHVLSIQNVIIEEPEFGLFGFIGQELMYIPAPGFIGEARVTYTVSDGEISDTAVATFQVVSKHIDTDGDGVFDFEENIMGTDINDIDTNKSDEFDSDLQLDSDHDGLSDASELANGTDFRDGNSPLIGGAGDDDGDDITNGNEDDDFDGLSNVEEKILGTDPNIPNLDAYTRNSDGDDLSDIMELQSGSNPHDILDPDPYKQKALDLRSSKLDNTQLDNILSNYTNLVYLNIASNDISNIDLLGGLNDLKGLNAEFNDIEDFSVLFGLNNIESLRLLSKNNIPNADFIYGMNNLRELTIRGATIDLLLLRLDVKVFNLPFCTVHNFEYINYFFALEVLKIDRAKGADGKSLVVDFSNLPLKSLKVIDTLGLRTSSIDLSDYANLEFVRLVRMKQLDGINPIAIDLSKIPNSVTELLIGFNNIIDLSLIRDFTNLKNLNISYLREVNGSKVLVDPSYISSSVETFASSGNRFVNSDFSNLTNLKTLVLMGVTDTSDRPLSIDLNKIPSQKLFRLYLNKTIADVLDFTPFTNLETLDIRDMKNLDGQIGSKLNLSSISNHISGLFIRDGIVEGDLDLRHLFNLKNLLMSRMRELDGTTVKEIKWDLIPSQKMISLDLSHGRFADFDGLMKFDKVISFGLGEVRGMDPSATIKLLDLDQIPNHDKIERLEVSNNRLVDSDFSTFTHLRSLTAGVIRDENWDYILSDAKIATLLGLENLTFVRITQNMVDVNTGNAALLKSELENRGGLLLY